MEDKSFYKWFFSLYIILVLQNVVTLSVNLTDNIMLGAYSEAALSGVAAVNQIQFIYQQLLMALGDGLVIFCSQYWGSRQIRPMKKIAAIAMRAGLLMAMILFFLVSVFPTQSISIFTTDHAIIAEGVTYIRIFRFTYFFFAVTQILLATMRSVEVVKIAFQLSIMTFAVNFILNYTLIFGKFGFPRLGAAGAATGTLFARILETIVLILYIRKKDSVLKLRIMDYLKPDRNIQTGSVLTDPEKKEYPSRLLQKDFFRIVLPMLCVQGLWGLNTAMQTVILGHMTASAIAANSAASTLFLIVKSAAVGAASAASIVIGKTIGTGDLPLVHRYADRLQKIFLIIGVLSGILLFFIRIPVLRLYDLSPATMAMTNQFLIVLSVVCVGVSYQMPTNNGIIRGGGNAMFVVKLDVISIWLIVIPISFFMAFVVKASPLVVLCCLNADQIFKCLPAYLEVRYGNWIRKLTR